MKHEGRDLNRCKPVTKSEAVVWTDDSETQHDIAPCLKDIVV